MLKCYFPDMVEGFKQVNRVPSDTNESLPICPLHKLILDCAKLAGVEVDTVNFCGIRDGKVFTACAEVAKALEPDIEEMSITFRDMDEHEKKHRQELLNKWREAMSVIMGMDQAEITDDRAHDYVNLRMSQLARLAVGATNNEPYSDPGKNCKQKPVLNV